jgi:glycosyltransferase involved in cell wall biosynthesis
MKVSVYAISKNEEKFAERWAKSMGEADEIYVLDTGSNDNTVEILEKNGVKVFTKIINPWRFDVARNESLSLIPDDTDICVCTDLDEVFEKGWRKKMEEAFKNGVTRLKYKYIWSFNSEGREDVVFNIEKAHSRFGYTWINPVHEILTSQNDNIAFAEGVVLMHFPDKTKSRSQYLGLLELAVEEDPENDRNMHYLGREYMYYQRYIEAINTLKKHLKLKNATWKDERCASMRYIAKCYTSLSNISEAYKYYIYAIAEAPYLREPWLDAAYFEYYRENWVGCIYFIEYALKITHREDNYITSASSWNETPYDVLSIAYYKIGMIDKAIEAVKKAISISDESRLKENLNIYEKAT